MLPSRLKSDRASFSLHSAAAQTRAAQDAAEKVAHAAARTSNKALDSVQATLHAGESGPMHGRTVIVTGIL